MRLPPHSIEAEQSVLGAALISGSAAETMIEMLQAGDYYYGPHRNLHEAIQALALRSEPADALTVPEELRRRGKLDAAGGIAYVNQLLDGVPTAAHVAHYAEIVADLAHRRRLREASAEIAADADDLLLATAEVQASAEEKLFAVPRRRSGLWVTLRDLYPPFVMRMDPEQRPEPGIPTGVPALNRMISGWKPGRLAIIGGRPGMGKTAFGVHLALAAAETGVPVAFFSLEMDRDEIKGRMVAQKSGLDGRLIEQGGMEPAEYRRAEAAARGISDLPIHINDVPHLTAAEVRSQARAMRRKEKIGLIVLDYLQRVQPAAGGEANVRHFTEVAMALKTIARELCIPVIALAQLSREVEKRNPPRPIMADLRESGGLEQEADLVILLYRPGYYSLQRGECPEGEIVNDSGSLDPVELIVGKHRQGAQGLVTIHYAPSCMRFIELDGRHDEAGAGPERRFEERRYV